MTRLQPRPAQMAAPTPTLDGTSLLPLAQVLRAAAIAQVDHARLLAVQGVPTYQVRVPGADTLRYFDARSGASMADADRVYAEELARHFAGERDAPVRELARVSAFDREYTFVNRLLPAWRVEFDRRDGLRAYVDTASSRLGTLVDTRKAAMQQVFQMLHNWRWLEGTEGARLTIMSILLAAALTTAALGLWIYGLRWRVGQRAHGLRRWHRTLGLCVSLTTFTFAASGGFHLIKLSGTRSAAAVQVTTLWSAQALDTLPPAPADLLGWALVDLGRKPALRVLQPAATRSAVAPSAHGGHAAAAAAPGVVYLTVGGGDAVDRARALDLAARFSGLPAERVTQTTLITRFAGEYGFVNKRLPVWKVEYDTPSRDRYYVETSTGALAAHIDDGDALEGWTFAYLHKWNWLDALGTGPRDAVAALFALGNAVVAALGLRMFLRRSRARRE